MTAPRLAPPRDLDAAAWAAARGEATALLQQLLRVDTSNPPGNELAAARVLAESLAADGLAAEIIEAAPGRASLVCRLRAAPGGATGEPLLLASHLDVVPAGDASRWRHPPFGGELEGGVIWGRGAVDMKNMVAMSAIVVKLLARRGRRLRRDIILAAVADEERACHLGSRFLVEQHPDKVRAGFALGEVGGFPLRVGRARVVMVQTAEKGLCWLRATARGPAGHGSLPRADSAPLKLARALGRIAEVGLPQHVTPPARRFVHELAARQPPPLRQLLPLLLHPRLGKLILARAMRDRHQARTFHALLHNTVAPTVLRAGEVTNVIPESASAELDGRLLPGQRPEDLIRELRAVIGDEIELEVLQQADGVVNDPPASLLWDCIREALARYDPTLEPLPYMIPGFTDAKNFCRLGARWYGFAPLYLDPDAGVSFSELFHAVDERIPEDGFHWGLGMLYEVVERFCAAEDAGGGA
jgi:acetylornithine deacetylase/succinyl-diaminopimelate desuccinylase-like protein